MNREWKPCADKVNCSENSHKNSGKDSVPCTEHRSIMEAVAAAVVVVVGVAEDVHCITPIRLDVLEMILGAVPQIVVHGTNGSRGMYEKTEKRMDTFATFIYANLLLPRMWMEDAARNKKGHGKGFGKIRGATLLQ